MNAARWAWPLLIAALAAGVTATPALAETIRADADCRRSIDDLEGRLAGLPEDAPLIEVVVTLQLASGEACGFNLFDPTRGLDPAVGEPISAPAEGDDLPVALESQLDEAVGDCPGAAGIGVNRLAIVTTEGGTVKDWEEGATGYIGKEHVYGSGPIVVEGHGPLTSLHVRWVDGPLIAVARIGGLAVPVTEVSGGVECGEMVIDVPGVPDSKVHQACDGNARGRMLDVIPEPPTGTQEGEPGDLDIRETVKTVLSPLRVYLSTHLRNPAACEDIQP